MKLTKTFESDSYSSTYIWAAIVEGIEFRYQLSVEDSQENPPPIRELELKARVAIMRAIENKLFGE